MTSLSRYIYFSIGIRGACVCLLQIVIFLALSWIQTFDVLLNKISRMLMLIDSMFTQMSESYTFFSPFPSKGRRIYSETKNALPMWLYYAYERMFRKLSTWFERNSILSNAREWTNGFPPSETLLFGVKGQK